MTEKKGHAKTCKSAYQGPEWSGYPNPDDPDNEWICDECDGVVPVVPVDDSDEEDLSESDNDPDRDRTP